MLTGASLLSLAQLSYLFSLFAMKKIYFALKMGKC